MKSGIYEILNKVNDKFYIGSAVNLYTRKNTHFWRLRNNKHHNNHLQASYNKHGEINFQFIVLEYCEKDKLVACEQFWMDWTEACRLGYNQRIDATSNTGIKRSLETINKFRASVMSHKVSVETRKKIGFANSFRAMIKREAFLMFLFDKELVRETFDV